MNSSCRFPILSLVRGLFVVSLAVSSICGITRAGAQTSVVNPQPKSTIHVGHQPITNTMEGTTSAVNPQPVQAIHVGRQPITTTMGSTTSAVNPAPQRMRGMTQAQRQKAAANMALRRSAGVGSSSRFHSNAIVGIPGNPVGPTTLDQLYFSAVYPNYADSPLPNVADTVNCKSPNFCGIRKFVDTLPLLNTANDLGNMLPLAVADTTTFPGTDYYEISLVQYRQQLHKDLPPVVGTYPNQTSGGTLLRGYVQTNAPAGSTSLTPSYLGPIIVSTSYKPVRIKFTNALPTGAPGNLFLPVDTTALGAGKGLAIASSPYLQNRATIHMHGGNTPWISDGTPHQWTIPGGDWGNTLYQRGDSVQFVPDMFFYQNGTVVPQCSATVIANCSDAPGMSGQVHLPAGATNDPGHGSLTFYYTNQQSARLLFYHDHAYGTTRLNVYAGEASAMLIQDPVELDLVNGTNNSGVFTKAGVAAAPAIPAEEIPLVIQDKTFVPQNPASTNVYSLPVLASGSGYAPPPALGPAVTFTGGCITEPTATANVGILMDPFGQEIDGAVTDITLLTNGSGCTSDPIVSIAAPPLPSTDQAAAFASVATLSQQDPTWDSAQWGGYGNLWYPHVYMTNQWPSNPDGSASNPMGRWDYASWFWPPFNGNPGQYTVRGELPCPTTYDPTMTCPGIPSALAPAPATEIDGITTNLGAGSTVSLTPEGYMDTPLVNGVPYPTLTVDPKPYRFRVLSVANERSFNLSWFLACDATNAQYVATVGAVCPTPTVAGIPGLTEVGMVPAVTTAGFPVWWPHDGRTGGVPDPKAMGPDWIQMGTEGGVLPAVAIHHPSPVSYETNLRSITVTNVQNHGLLLMSAERADAIVDFTLFHGKTLILYNDSPAPMPAHDDRNDYFTGDADQTGTGGAPTTLAGFGPNTRTLMQVVVRSSIAGQAEPAVNLINLSKLIPAAFNISQPPPIIPEPAYQAAYPGNVFKAVYPSLQATTMTFTPIDPSTKMLSTVINPGSTTPAVTLEIRNKTIQELFDLDYGRMNATLGTELPLTNYNTQTTIPLNYIDPFTEDLYDSADVAAKPVGTAGDGSQLWIIIHNGVDTHAIHFHLYDVQVINRYGWDGTNRVPFPDEMGWKDTVRMNPLEMDFVALRPMSQTLPFPVPDSSRLFDVTKPAGADLAMSAFDPLNNAAPQTNTVVPMGWEYVWHCHLLGHEENDMMREQVFQVPPQTPLNFSAVATAQGNRLIFTDMSLSEAGFEVERADDINFTLNLNAAGSITAPASPGWNNTVTFYDTTGLRSHPYYYRVRAFKPDADYWMPLIGNGSTNPTNLPNLVSGWTSGAALQAAPALSVNYASLAFGSQAYNTTSNPKMVTVSNNGLGVAIFGTISITGVNAADFRVSATTCPVAPANLGSAKNCTISVTFKPTYGGARSATLSIVSNDPLNSPILVPLTGTVPPLPLTITASSATVNWTGTVPAITPTIVGLVGTDTAATLGINCSSPYTVTSPAGTYSTSCSVATNPNNTYAITFVTGKLIVNPIAARMLTPVPSTQFAASTVPFTWTSGGATNYRLLVGSRVAWGDVFTGSTTANSLTVLIQPNSGWLYVRLFTLVNGTWQFYDYMYLASVGPPPAGLAAIATPTPGTTLTTSPVTFTWNANSATAFQLIVGTRQAWGDLYTGPQTTALSSPAVAVPTNGSTIYVRLYSFINGSWLFTDYVYY